jgi:hypothetical protein
MKTVLTVVVCAVAGAVACGNEAQTSGDLSPRDAYASPESPVIKPGSLRAFDVTKDGALTEVDLSQLAPIAPPRQANNWDWGDEGVYSPSNSGSATEVEAVLSPGYVMTGIGARVGGGAVTRLRLRQIGIRENGTWDAVGAIWRDWVRHPSDDGGNLPELELAVPKPFVAVGIGFGITNQNVAAISIKKREYSPAQRKLIGSETMDSQGVGRGELYWDTSFVTQTPADKEKMVVVGVGLRENNDNLSTLRVWSAYLD